MDNHDTNSNTPSHSLQLTKHSSGLNLIIWNANGIRNKLHEFIEFIKARNAHIIMLTETRLKQHNRFYLPGYTVFREDEISPRRGILLAVRNELKPIQNALPNTGHLEALSISIQTLRGLLNIICVYNSPAGARPLDIKILRTLFQTNNQIIIGGDLNARHIAWGCRSCNDNGRKLYNFCTSQGIGIIHPNEPTRYPSNARYSPSVLDLALCKGLSGQNAKAISWNCLDSDHNPVVIKLKRDIETNHSLYWDLRKANWSEYRRLLCNSLEITPIASIEELESQVEALTKAIISAASMAIPKRVFSSRGESLPNQIKELIKEKNKARRSWTRRRTPSNRRMRNFLEHQVKCEVAEWRKERWLAKISRLTSKDGSLWQFMRQMQGRKTQIGPLEHNQTLEYRPHHQASILASTYETQFRSNQNSKLSGKEMLKEAQDLVRQNKETQPIPPIKPKDVREAIAMIKTKKAPGYDKILPIFVKNLPGKTILHLSKIFQAMIDLECFPSLWKKAEIVPVKKPGKDPTQPVNYRPISLLPVLGKLAERFILTWLEKETTEKHILPNYQFGFRRGHSTVDQIVRVTQFIKERLRLKKATGMILLDIAKAFDSVCHLALVLKLLRYNLPNKLCHLIADFLKDRTFRVKLNSVHSEWRPVQAGVPQGALLSPLLYAIFTSDMPNLQHVQIAQYADDTALFYSNKNFKCLVRRIEEAASEVSDYLHLWRLKLNNEKSEAILFTKKRKYLNTTIRIKNTALQWRPKVKYLGVTLDRRQSWAANIQDLLAKSKAALRAVWPLLKQRSALGLHSKMLIYKMIIRPKISYGAPAWLPLISASNKRKLERVQSKILRTIADPPPGINNAIIREGLKMDTLSDHLEKITKNFWRRTEHHTSQLMRQLKRM